MAQPGDTVKILTKDEQFEGTLLPRPDILDQDVVVLKLDSGYNIGIDKKRIKKIETLKPHKPVAQKKLKLKNNPKLPTVSILSFGGTISSRLDYKTGGVIADYTAEDFVQMCPELEKIANLKAKKIGDTMSEDFCENVWSSIAKHVAKELNNGADGVVVTQGTDTLHFSTAALSFLLKDLSKPVVFTAAQRSIDRGSSDAFMNLICAVTAASKFDGAGVYTCLHATTNDDYCYLLNGVTVRKMHTSRRDAFRPVNDLPLAEVYPDGKIKVLSKDYEKRSKGKVSTDLKFESKVALITVYPGQNPEVLDFYLKKGYKGIVLAATALGHVPTLHKDHSFLPALDKAQKAGIPVIIASQTLYGPVHPYVYSNLRRLSIERNCIFVEAMLPETAYLKLSWVLGHTNDPQKVREMMLTNYHGEISERTQENTFLV